MKDYTPLEYNEKDKKRCPHCNNYIPRVSEYCPFCGLYLKKMEQAPEIEKLKKSARHLNDPNWSKYIIAVLAFSVIIMVSYFIVIPRMSGQSTSASINLSVVDSQERPEDPAIEETDQRNSTSVSDQEVAAVVSEESESSPTETGKEDDAKPKILLDSSVILQGDTIPIRFFDGENTYAYNNKLSYYSTPNTVDIEPDNSGYRYYVRAKSSGETTIVGQMGDLEIEKVVYVVSEKDATNGVSSDIEKIVLNVTNSGAGAVSMKVAVDGKSGEDLEARFTPMRVMT